jgi:xylan 1,4-beta-xylosidase
VETPNGQWYVAHLCARPLGPGRFSVLGRETAIQQVEWTDDGWLALTAGGTVAQLRTPEPGGPKTTAHERLSHRSFRDDFDGPAIDRRFSTLRRPFGPDWITLEQSPGALSVRGGDALTSRFDVSLVATQLQDFTATVTTHVTVEPRHFSHSAGLVVFYDNLNFAYLRVYRSESLDSTAIGIVLVDSGAKRELLLDRVAIGANEATLQAQIDDGNLQFSWRNPDGDLEGVGPLIDATFMSDEATRGFTGTMIGITCVDSYRRDLFAHFDYFDIQHGAH